METAASKWMKLDSLRADKLRQAEELSALTVAKLFPIAGDTPDSSSKNNDYQSFGAQCVNHLTTKLMLTLFSPSRPFIRLDPADKLVAQMATAGINVEDLQTVLSKGEMRAVKQLDALALRPKLFEVIKHLIVIGNVLMILNRKTKGCRVMSMRNYVVKRNVEGQLYRLVIKERVKFDELADDVQKAMADTAGAPKDDDEVDFYIMVERDGDKYNSSQWVNDTRLPEEFDGRYDEATLPYRVLTWDLADKDDYGTGLAEDYMGDLSALSVLSESLVNAAILASEYRWLANPGGMTRAEDFNESQNGECLPGVEGDLSLVHAGGEVAPAMQIQSNTIADYIGRIGRGFLMSTAVTRNAERVTAEEIRMQAQELETGLGGAYSRLAVDVQKPMAHFLLDSADLTLKGQSIEVLIITGLDALSRNGDLENLKLFLQDVGALGVLPPDVLSRLKLDTIIKDLGTGRGIVANKYVKSDSEVQQDRTQQAGNEIATAGGVAQAEAAAQPQPQGAA